MRVRGLILLILGVPAVMCSSAIARPPAHGLTCARRPGHTLRRVGAVRIYRHDGQQYGCARGRSRTMAISGVVMQLAGVSALLVHVTEDDRYAYAASTNVVNLQTGKQYRVSSEDEPLGLPWSLAPGLVETVVLGADGLTARLYETPAPTGAPDPPPPTTETLDVVGDGDHVLATGAPGSIEPRSIRFADGEVAWT
jgi:hypothetical protein